MKTRSRSIAAAITPVFEKKVALDITEPLAQAAYDITDDKPLLLPTGYRLVGPIKIDKAHIVAMMAAAPLSQQRLMRTVLSEGDTGGLVARHDESKTLAVSFRGTRTPEEWLKDFDFVHANYSFLQGWGKVHKGFQLVYKAMRSSVADLVDASGADITSAWVIGHSLGGAVAALCAPDFGLNMTKVVPQLHTYAAPRSGNGDFEKKFDKLVGTCFRIVNRWDIVWHLPTPITGYRHVGQEVEIDGGITIDLRKAHSLEESYRPGLEKLVTRKALIGIAA